MTQGSSKLKLECMAIGSLPHKDLDKAMDLVKNNFANIPFWPQLAKINKNEDMIFQFLENMPSFFYDTDKIYLNTEYETFFDDLENFFLDYEEIISDIDSDKLDKYAITTSCAFPKLIEIIKETKPEFAKGQIVGPFTLAASLCTLDGCCAIYDDTLKEIILKTLTLKALWQIREMKKANPDITPIIFIDEPTISQLGTSAFVTITANDVIEMLNEVSEIIKTNGALSAIHCCGKCDWSVPLKCGVDLINLDAYSYAENLSVFKKEVQSFLEKGGKIAWGVVPTLDKIALENADIDLLNEKFLSAVKYLTKKGIDEKLVIRNSIITPSCGAGGLDEKFAEKAMELTKALSTQLKERYKFDD